MKVAVVNPTKDIVINVDSEVTIEKGGRVIYSQQLIGFIWGANFDDTMIGRPKETKIPKREMLEGGTGKVLSTFDYTNNRLNKSFVGITIEFTPDEVHRVSDTKLKNIEFILGDPNHEKIIKFYNQFRDTRLVECKIKTMENKIFMIYDGYKIGYSEIKFIKDRIPDCDGKVVRIDEKRNKAEVQACYNLNDSVETKDDKLDKFEEEYKGIYDYLKLNNIDDFFISKIFSQYRDYGEFNSLIPNPEKHYIDEGDQLLVALTSVIRGKNLRFVGPRGTGKNLLVDTIGWILQRPVINMSVSEDIDKYDIIGNTTLVEGKSNDQNGYAVTQYEEHYLITAMKFGCILNLDEVNTADSARLAILHSACDSSRSFTLQSGEKIVADKNFFVVCTMNEGYVGTKSLNLAFIDRFVPIKLNYLNKIVPILTQNRDKTVDRNTLGILESVYSKIIESIRDGILDDTALSIRGFEDALDMIEDGISVKRSLEIGLIYRTSDYFEDKLKEIVKLYTVEEL